MEKVGYIERASHDLSPDIWRKLIEELDELDRQPGDLEYGDLKASVIERSRKIAEFEWEEEEDEIIVRGELEDVRFLAERIATRLGGKFTESL